MIYGIGTDICETTRMKMWLKPSSTRDIIFTPGEVEHWKDHLHPERTIAGLWAAKEAYKKASGKLDMKMSDIEVIWDDNGKPLLMVPKNADQRVMVSISHDKEYATAMVVIDQWD